MAAKRTPGQRTLSPEIPVVSYPTPNLGDLLVVQDVDTRLPDYAPLEYGDLHPDQLTYPGLKLVFQSPLDLGSDYMWVRRVYSKDRQDEDAYNFAVKYSDSNPAYPIYVRTYTILRAEYLPLSSGSPDPVYPSALLVSEEVVRFKGDAEEGSLDSLYVKVLRIYETLPGPGVTRYETNEAGQTVEVTTQRKLQGPNYTPPTANALTAFSSEVAEENVITDTVRRLPEVFPAKVLSIEAPDPAPQKFRIAAPSTTTEEIVTGDAVQPVLLPGEFAKSEQQQTEFTKRTRKTSRPTTGLPKTLIQKATNEVKQLETISETLQTGDTLEAPTATQSIESEALGDGTFVVRKTSVPEVFDAKLHSAEKSDVVPIEFRGEKPLIVEETTELGQAVAVTLSGNQVSKSEQSVTKFTKRTRNARRDLTTNATLLGEQIDQDGVKVTVTKTLSSGSQSISPSAMVSGLVEAIGDGKTVKTELYKSEVFDAKTEAATKPDTIPEKFRANASVKTTQQVLTKNTATSPALGTNEYSKSEKRLTNFTVEETKVTREGNLNQVAGQILEEAWGINIPYTEYISSSIPSGETIEGEGLDDKNHVVRQYDKAALDATLQSFSATIPTSVDLDLPRVLTDVKVTWTEEKSESESDFNGNGAMGAFKSLTQKDDGEVSSTLSLIPNFEVQFTDVWGKNIRAKQHLFFLKKDQLTEGQIKSKVGASGNWPVFKPKSFLGVANGKSETKYLQLFVSRAIEVNDTPTGYGYQPASGSKTKTEISLRPVALNIPPCLCRGINVNSTKSLTATNRQITLQYPTIYTTIASGGSITFPAVNITKQLSHTMSAQVSMSIPATTQTDTPKSGTYVVSSSAEPYKFGWFLVRAVTVDAAQLA